MQSADRSRMRGLVKRGVARALFWTGSDSLLGNLGDHVGSAVVLGYHRVVDDFDVEAESTIPAMLVTTRMLEEQLEWIGRRFRFVDLDELGKRLESGDTVDRIAAVTFDDGYQDVYEHAYPLLQRMGIPSAVFVVTAQVGRREMLAHDRLYLGLRRAFARWEKPAECLRRLLVRLRIDARAIESGPNGNWTPGHAVVWFLRSLPQNEIQRVAEAVEAEVGVDAGGARGFLPMTWEMLAAMQDGGVIVGSHTRTHAWLTLENEARVGDELHGSRCDLESRLGVAVRHFAYPDGQFNRAMTEAVAAAGYRFAYTTCGHRDARHPLLTIPRRMLWQNACLDGRGRFSPAVLSCHVNGVFDWVRGCDHNHAA